jgi:hypothetical protein
MTQTKGAPARANEPEAVPRGLTLEQANCTQSIAKNRRSVYGRSEEHPTFYLVGTFNDSKIFWHPVIGYAIGTPYGLRALHDEALSGVKWFDEGIFYQIVEDVELSYGILRRAMDERLLAEIDKLREDEAFADECKSQKRRVAELSNPSLGRQQWPR